MTGMNPKWKPLEDSRLIAGVIKGLTASQIAKRLPGRTRNSVIGRFHRLRISGAINKNMVLGGPKKKIKKAINPPVIPAPTLIPIPASALHIATPIQDETLTIGRNECRYPMWGERPNEPREYCGGETFGGTNYCARHLVRCYQKHPKLAEAREAIWQK